MLIIVERGCRALNIRKGMVAEIVEAVNKGPDYSHQAACSVVFRVPVGYTKRGNRLRLWARHINRLRDPEFNLSTGRPEHRIRVRYIGEAR